MESTNQNLEGIIEVKELHSEAKVNKLLQDGNWRLLQLTTEKVIKTTVKEGQAHSIFGGILYAGGANMPVVNEELQTKYVLGKYRE